MKNKTFALLLVFSLFLFVALYRIDGYRVSVDNTTSIEECIAKDYGLKKLLLAKAIFDVRRGFENVTAFDLTKEVGIKLDCKRQVFESQFYYVTKGDGHRCFIITDPDDIVQEVLVIKDFPTIEQTKDYISKYGEDIPIALSPAHQFRDLWRDIGFSSVYRNCLFTLQDGVMIMQSVSYSSEPTYYYFTDAEWDACCEEWGGFAILPIDKQP